MEGRKDETNLLSTPSLLVIYDHVIGNIWITERMWKAQ